MPTQTCLQMFQPNPSSCSSDQNPCYKTFAGSEPGGFWRNSKFRKKTQSVSSNNQKSGLTLLQFSRWGDTSPWSKTKIVNYMFIWKEHARSTNTNSAISFQVKDHCSYKSKLRSCKKSRKKIALNGIWPVQCRYPWPVKPKLRTDHLLSS